LTVQFEWQESQVAGANNSYAEKLTKVRHPIMEKNSETIFFLTIIRKSHSAAVGLKLDDSLFYVRVRSKYKDKAAGQRLPESDQIRFQSA
jgi:hypothetical protein